MMNPQQCRAKARYALYCATRATDSRAKSAHWDTAIEWMVLGNMAEAQDRLQHDLIDRA